MTYKLVQEDEDTTVVYDILLDAEHASIHTEVFVRGCGRVSSTFHSRQPAAQWNINDFLAAHGAAMTDLEAVEETQ